MTGICFFTLGCKVNQYETQALTRRFAAQGYLVCGEDTADVLVVNSCTVTAKGDSKCRRLLHRLHREHPAAILCLTGCYPQAYPAIADELPELDVVTGSRDRAGLLTAVQRRLASGERVVHILPHQQGEAFESMEVETFPGHTRAFVKIEDGCENHCAYCIIPTARGPVRSKPLPELQAELQTLAAGGYREVVLAGINLSSYGREFSLRLIDAVEAACAVEGIARVRLGSLEPDLITPTDIARMAAQPEFCPQFHLSLQSGSDSVLARMGRRYTTAEYIAVVDTIRAHFPDASLTTDLMVGFPGETEQEFTDSVAFAQRVGFADIHVFAYSSRAGTRAADMPGQVAPALKKQRSNALLAVATQLRLSFLQGMAGQFVEVLYEERRPDGSQRGYTRNYTPVTVAEPEYLHGRLQGTLISGVAADGDGCEGIVLG